MGFMKELHAHLSLRRLQDFIEDKDEEDSLNQNSF